MISNIYNAIESKFGGFGAAIVIICAISLVVIILLYVIPTIADKRVKAKNADKKSFSDKHSQIFTVISFLVALIIICLVLWILKGVFTGLGHGISWLVNKASKLDVVIVVALITGMVSIVSAIVAKIIDYRKRKSEYLAQKREQPYEDFLVMYYKIQDNTNNPGSYPNEEMIQDIYKFSKGITLWGSKKVVKRWVQFRELANSGKSQEMMIVIEKLMNEMRKDMGTKRVKKGNLLALTINDIKDYIK